MLNNHNSNSNQKPKLDEIIKNLQHKNVYTNDAIVNDNEHEIMKMKPMSSSNENHNNFSYSSSSSFCGSSSSSGDEDDSSTTTSSNSNNKKFKIDNEIKILNSSGSLMNENNDLSESIGESDRYAEAAIVRSVRAEFEQQQKAEMIISDTMLNNTNAIGEQLSRKMHAPKSPQSNGDAINRVANVYRGLYPIRNVKQYFKKITIDNNKLYICLWPDCKFQTLKYSQHISRHIYLKHIGIKELRCKQTGCDKVFKRPESLVQHVKNHICGFGIDQTRMKDPNNTCGVKNIRRYFEKIMDNDIQLFKCQFGRCKFVTNNSGSIRRHVHNQHICPHPANPTNGPTISPNEDLNSQRIDQTDVETINHSSNSYAQSHSGFTYNALSNMPDVEQSFVDPLVVLTEYDNATYDPVKRLISQQSNPAQQDRFENRLSCNGNNYHNNLESSNQGGNSSDYNPDSPIDLSRLSVGNIASTIPSTFNRIDADDYDDDDDNNEHEIEGNSSLCFPHYHIDGSDADDADKEEDEDKAEEEIDEEFEKDNNETQFDNNFAKHAASFLEVAPPSIDINGSDLAFSRFAAHHSAPSTAPTLQGYLQAPKLVASPSASHSFLSTNSGHPMNNSVIIDNSAAARRKNNGLYSLKNYKEYYYKVKTADNGVQFICKLCKLAAKSQITLIRHLWTELNYKEFNCEFEGCDRTFDNEFSRYKHRKFDHGQTMCSTTAATTATNNNQSSNDQLTQPARPDSASSLNIGISSALQESISSLVPPVPMEIASNNNMNALAQRFMQMTPPNMAATSLQTNYSPSAKVFSPSNNTFNPINFSPHLADNATATASFLSASPFMDNNSTSRRLSNVSSASSSDCVTPGFASTSSLVSILQAPSASLTVSTASRLGQINPRFDLDANSPNALLHSTFSSQRMASSPSQPNEVDAEFASSSKRTGSISNHRQPGIFSLKNYAEQFEKISTTNGDLFSCCLCKNYQVRSQASIVKHLCAHSRGEIRSIESVPVCSVSSEELALTGHSNFDDVHRKRSCSLSVDNNKSPQNNTDEDDVATRDVDDINECYSARYSFNHIRSKAQDQRANSLNAKFSELAEISAKLSSQEQASVRKYNCRSKTGLYSLKKHEEDYIRSKGPDGYHYKCANCEEYSTKSQASMIRHIWTHKKQNFKCDCGESFENEFSLYKHKKNKHPESTSQHNRSSGKNSKKVTTATTAAVATASSENSGTGHDSNLNSFLNENQNYPQNDIEQEQQQQQQQQQQLQLQQQVNFLNWISAQQNFPQNFQQFMAMQLQQQQQQFESQSRFPNHFDLFNIAYQSIQNGHIPLPLINAKEEEEEKDENIINVFRSDEEHKLEEKENNESVTWNQGIKSEPKKGMSRRALMFKSQKHKPIQIRPQQNADEIEDEAVTEEENRKDILNQLKDQMKKCYDDADDEDEDSSETMLKIDC